MKISSFFFNIRFYVLIFSAFLAGLIYVIVGNNSSSEGEKVLRLTQYYALTALTYLYLSLFASPYARILTFMPKRGMYLKARRALGVSTFLFACLHVYFAFFKVIGGFAGLGSLPSDYLLSITFGFISFMILFLLAATATDFAVSKLTFPRWKFLHRFVYLVAILIAMHALRIGEHFSDFGGLIPRIFFMAAFVLLIFEMIRLIKYIRSKI